MLEYFRSTFTTNFKWYIVTDGQKNSFSSGFKLKTCNNLPIRICCESVI